MTTQQPDHPNLTPKAPDAHDDLADEMSMESFPGSDPPSSWAGRDLPDTGWEQDTSRNEGDTAVADPKGGNPATPDQDAQPPGNGITTPVDQDHGVAHGNAPQKEPDTLPDAGDAATGSDEN